MSSFRLVLLALSLVASPALGQSEEEEGRALVEANCSGCHGVGLTDESPHPDAPPFRTLSERYPIDTLDETLSHGFTITHPDMPDFLATASQIDEITAYIVSLQSIRPSGDGIVGQPSAPKLSQPEGGEPKAR